MFANYLLLNYLVVALRNLRKQPGFTAIKVLSLSLGVICSLLVMMHVQYTYSYDKHFDNWQNIYRVVASLTTTERIDGNMIADGQVSVLLQDYPQIAQLAKVSPGNGIFAYGDVSALNSYYWVEPSFLSIFSFDFIRGTAENALTEPNTIVINETTAAKYFGSEDPLGKNITFDNNLELRVTGVIADLPINTHFDIQAMIGVSTGRQVIGENFMNAPTNWGGYGGIRAYVLIPDAGEAERIQQDLPNYIERNIPEQQRFAQIDQRALALHLEPLADIHLSPRTGFSAPDYTRRLVLSGLMVFAALILLSSCINFANLSLSQMQQRGKEIGVRKTLGAGQSDLLMQFLMESMLLTLIALLVAIPFIYLVIPSYTTLTDTGFTFASIMQSSQVAWMLLFVLLAGFLSGLVPALRMSRFQPTAAISGKRDGGRTSRRVRSALTVVQFSFAVVLVILALAISVQVQHLNNVDPGFNRSNLIVLDSMYNPRTPELFNYETMINELKSHPGIVAVGSADSLPPSNGPYNPWRRANWPAEDAISVSHLGVNVEYLDAMQLQLLAGRNFSTDFPADFIPATQPDPSQTYGALLTTEGVRNFGFTSNEEALDEPLILGNINFRVIGVVGQFRLSGGLEDPLRMATVLRSSQQPMRGLLIRIDPLQQESALAHIDATWERHRPDASINRSFFEQNFDQLIYARTNGINRAAQFSALITIVIAAFGLYALAYYSTERRTKEIGIRKVLGATPQQIVNLLTLEFIKPVLLACVIAGVGAYFVTDYFFSQFADRAQLSALFYIAVFAGTLVLAVLTVALQCYKTAGANPVQSLRSE